MSIPERPHLRALADRLGILPDYVDCGGVHHSTLDTTREGLLSALGFDASSEASASAALAQLDHAESRRLLDAIRVVSDTATEELHIPFRALPVHGPSRVDWHADIVDEEGRVRGFQGACDAVDAASKMVARIRQRMDCGYYRVKLHVYGNDFDEIGEQFLVIVPTTCFTFSDKCRGRRLLGIWSNLYTVRSEQNWGVGDCGDLRQLVDLASEVGVAAVGLNPLHATRNHDPDISPYRSLTRLFCNPIYLDLHSIPEVGESPAAHSAMEASSLVRDLDCFRAASNIDYGAIWRRKCAVLRELYAAFVEHHRDRPTARGGAYAQFMRERGDAMRSFATFVALDGFFRDQGVFGWQAWPIAYRDHRSPAVRDFRDAHAEEIGFQCYLQFALDQQLGDVARHAASLGLPIGLLHDLAIGTAPDGADPWLYPDVFVEGASIGAPPDALAPQGQDWGLAPLHPLRLRESGYRYWIDVLRGAFAHAGALRMDHVMGLLRQFWIPKGHDGVRGAYISFPSNDLFGILALESRRHKAFVVGEDLGTVPPGFSETLERWGILSTRVLYFERDGHGEFTPPHGYCDRALVAANTHDLPPLAGFWTGRDLELRRATGQIKSEKEWSAACARRESDRQALLRCLRREGLWQSDSAEASYELVAAICAMLSRTPAPLMGVSLDDVALETEPVNLPGVKPDAFASWTRRMTKSLAELRSPAALQLFHALSDRQVFGTQRPGG